MYLIIVYPPTKNNPDNSIFTSEFSTKAALLRAVKELTAAKFRTSIFQKTTERIKLNIETLLK